MDVYDIICVGAGPTGLATAIEAKRAGMRPLVIDKACLCNSIFHYPVNMVFFTTPELLEIGDLPLVCAAEKPTRVEALKYQPQFQSEVFRSLTVILQRFRRGWKR